MDLPTFIREVGDEKAAVLFDVPVRTVRSWRHAERKPRPNKALHIERATKGRVRFSEIYSPQ